MTNRLWLITPEFFKFTVSYCLSIPDRIINAGSTTGPGRKALERWDLRFLVSPTAKHAASSVLVPVSGISLTSLHGNKAVHSFHMQSESNTDGFVFNKCNQDSSSVICRLSMKSIQYGRIPTWCCCSPSSWPLTTSVISLCWSYRPPA